MKIIKVLYALSNLDGGGAEKVGLNLINNLNPNKFNCTLFLHKNEGVFLNQLSDKVKLEYLINQRISKFNNRILSLLSLPFLFLKSLKLVSKHDILIAGLESTYITYFIILSGIIHNKPVIIYVHNDISNNSKLKKSFHYLLIKSLYKYCSICVSVSEGVREGIIKEIPSIGKKCKVIYNPFNIDEINVMSALPISLNIPYPFIVSSGRLEQIKRFDLLIEAHHKVLNLGIKHCLIIIGKGTCFSHLKELVSKLGVESTVYFVGFDLNPHKWVSKAFCFVLSSENEGFGNVLVESMAVGTPVISTDCPSGPSEILEQGKYGLLVENKNSEELAKAIIRMFNDQDIYNFYKLNCRERSNLYSIDKIILQWENLLTHTVKDYKF